MVTVSRFKLSRGRDGSATRLARVPRVCTEASISIASSVTPDGSLITKMVRTHLFGDRSLDALHGGTTEKATSCDVEFGPIPSSELNKEETSRMAPAILMLIVIVVIADWMNPELD